MSRLVTSLCALPSFGATGAPVLIGGTSGSTDAGSPIDVTSLPRATAAPSTTLPPIGSSGAAYAFMSDGLVWFDGFSALYGLSKHAASPNFSASFWFNPYTEETSALTGPQKFGCIFANSEGVTTTAPAGEQEPTQFRLQYTPNPPASVVGMALPTIHNIGVDPAYPADVGFAIDNSTAPGFSLDPLDFMAGWCHVMYSHHVVSGQVVVNIYVNDTAILSGHVSSHTFHNVTEYFDETFNFPWNVADFTSFDNTSCPWTVGGTQYYQSDGSIPNTDVTLPLNGGGLIGAMMEVWIAPGQYVDWSSSGNRGLFHSADLAGLSWAPTNIGKDGSAPTGTKPQYYFTGNPDNFPINRATGKNVAVFHNSSGASLDGVINRLIRYGVVPG